MTEDVGRQDQPTQASFFRGMVFRKPMGYFVSQKSTDQILHFAQGNVCSDLGFWH